MRSKCLHPNPPKTKFFLQRKNKCPDEIFAGYHPGVVQGTVPENWSENASIFQRLDTIFNPIKYLKTATTRTGHGGFRTIYGGFSSWSNLTWAYFLLVGLKLDQLEKLFSTICHQKCLVEIHRDTHWKFMFSRFGGLWFCSCCFGFWHQGIGVFSSKTALDTGPPFTQTESALHHIKGLSCKQTNSLERHVSVWGFCRMRVFFSDFCGKTQETATSVWRLFGLSILAVFECQTVFLRFRKQHMDMLFQTFKKRCEQCSKSYWHSIIPVG